MTVSRIVDPGSSPGAPAKLLNSSLRRVRLTGMAPVSKTDGPTTGPCEFKSRTLRRNEMMKEECRNDELKRAPSAFHSSFILLHSSFPLEASPNWSGQRFAKSPGMSCPV
jgi:hypothetical protein